MFRLLRQTLNAKFIKKVLVQIQNLAWSKIWLTGLRLTGLELQRQRVLRSSLVLHDYKVWSTEKMGNQKNKQL